ncbi:RNA replication [Gossypium arboreum]|uniref:RNA replication n=1 Tax=Gossypium arboreum TaxID=29729 RepID=A0A0B0N804_GOSAR|nr:RNA replication [Gossypium arboreum]
MQGTSLVDSRPTSSNQEGEAKKHGAEEFKATDDDDAERAEFWLDNTIRMFDELSCTPDECLKCVISLLRVTTYQWWNTLVSVVPKERET